MLKTYTKSLQDAIDMLNAHAELEPTSALKQAASDNGIAWGDDMAEFIGWANQKLFGSETQLSIG